MRGLKLVKEALKVSSYKHICKYFPSRKRKNFAGRNTSLRESKAGTMSLVFARMCCKVWSRAWPLGSKSGHARTVGKFLSRQDAYLRSVCLNIYFSIRETWAYRAEIYRDRTAAVSDATLISIMRHINYNMPSTRYYPDFLDGNRWNAESAFEYSDTTVTLYK